MVGVVRYTRRHPFTLIELVVTVVLLGVLAGVAAVAYQPLLGESELEMLAVEVRSFDNAYNTYLLLDDREVAARVGVVLAEMGTTRGSVDTSEIADGVVVFSQGSACLRLTLQGESAVPFSERVASCGDDAGTTPPTTTTTTTTTTIPLVLSYPSSELAFPSGSGAAFTASVSGEAGPYSYTVSAGMLPTGVTLGSDGVLSGTGTYRFRPEAVSAGYDFTCALDFEGAVWCWGKNSWNQLGIGATGDRHTPTKVADGAITGGNVGFSVISAGEYHACAIKAGEAYCWGYNNTGQLGDGTKTTRNAPVKVVDGAMGNTGLSAIDAGSAHTCAIKAGEAYCWGGGTNGKLGDGTNTDRWTPVKVLVGAMPSTSSVDEIGAGEDNTCVLRVGEAYCWGNALNGAVGNGFTTGVYSTPVKVSDALMGNSGLSGLSVGNRSVCVLKSGVAWCWGAGTASQITGSSHQDSPMEISGGAMGNSGITQISVGDFHSCAVKGGEAYCWGRNSEGQLGDGTTTSRTSPVKVLAGAMGGTTEVSHVSAGGITFGSESHSCVTRAAELYCFGYRGSGRIGDGSSSTGRYTSPVAVLPSPGSTTVTVTVTTGSGRTGSASVVLRTASS
jgi:prepilin-type N-terminal cleavage/methylation domain-containing protein